MITLLTIAICAGATAVASASVAAGRRWARNRRAAVAPVASSIPPEVPGPFGLGDVLVLERGRGTELWMARRLRIVEGTEPFLVVYEADGRADERAVVVFDPSNADWVDVLVPQRLDASSMIEGGRSSRPPAALEVMIEGADVRVDMHLRRTAKGDLASVPEAEGSSVLPAAGDELLVVTYRGRHHARALLVRDGQGVAHGYVGRAIALAEMSVMGPRGS